MTAFCCWLPLAEQSCPVNDWLASFFLTSRVNCCWWTLWKQYLLLLCEQLQLDIPVLLQCSGRCIHGNWTLAVSVPNYYTPCLKNVPSYNVQHVGIQLQKDDFSVKKVFKFAIDLFVQHCSTMFVVHWNFQWQPSWKYASLILGSQGQHWPPQVISTGRCQRIWPTYAVIGWLTKTRTTALLWLVQ